MTRPAQLICHGNFAAQCSDRGSGNRIDARLSRLISKPVGVLPFRKLQTAAAAPQDDPDSPPGFNIEFTGAQTRILKRLARRSNGQSGSPGDVLSVFG